MTTFNLKIITPQGQAAKIIQLFKGDRITRVDDQVVSWVIDELIPFVHYPSILGINPCIIHPIKIGITQIDRKNPAVGFDEFGQMPIHIHSGEPLHKLDSLPEVFAWGQIRYIRSHRNNMGVGGDNNESEGHIVFYEAAGRQARMFKAAFINRDTTLT